MSENVDRDSVASHCSAADRNRWIRSDSLSVFIGHDSVPLVVRLNGGTWEWSGEDATGWEPWTDCASREHAEANAMVWYRGE
jgi:hypothetical protein